MKKVFVFFICLALMIGVLPFGASAAVYNGTCAGGIRWAFNTVSGELGVSGKGELKCDDGRISMPWDEYGIDIKKIKIGEGITGIGDYVFSHEKEITELKLPSSVESIGTFAFGNCTSLKTVELPSSLLKIGREAFSGCESLVNVEIPSRVVTIEKYAFSGCSSLKEINIPASVQNISESVFSFCESLEGITVDKENCVYHSNGNCLIKTSEGVLLAGCKYSLISSDGSVRTIEEGAFEWHTGLKELNIPAEVSEIKDGAFYGASASLERITVEEGNVRYTAVGNCLIDVNQKRIVLGCRNSEIPDDGSVRAIGNSAFEGCAGLKSIIIPDSVTGIGDYAFSESSDLEEVVLPSSLQVISYRCFAECPSLLSIVIQNSVYEIEEQAFYECRALKTIYYTGSESEWDSIIIPAESDTLLTLKASYDYVIPEIVATSATTAEIPVTTNVVTQETTVAKDNKNGCSSNIGFSSALLFAFVLPFAVACQKKEGEE